MQAVTKFLEMEFFIDDRETEDLFQQIFKEIQLLRNGEIHQEMNKFGLNYEKSLGASIVNLREIGKRYQKDHLLAHKLWTKGYRESKIVASLLEEPEKVTPEQLERWFKEMESNELMQQVSMNLFQFLPNRNDLLLEWMKSDDASKIVCAVMTAGRMAMFDKDSDDQIYMDLIDLLPEKSDDKYFMNQLKRTLGKIVRRGGEVKTKVVNLVTNLKDKDEQYAEIWDDLKYELQI